MVFGWINVFGAIIVILILLILLVGFAAFAYIQGLIEF